MTDWTLLKAFILLLATLCPSCSAKSLLDPFDVLDNSHNPEVERYNTPIDAIETELLHNCTEFYTSQEFTILANGSLFIINQNQTVQGGFFIKHGTAFLCEEDVYTNIAILLNNVTETVKSPSINTSENVTGTEATFSSESVAETEKSPSYNFSDEFLRCGHVLILPEEYNLLENGTIYIEIYSKSYGPLDYLIVNEGVYICVPSFDELKQNVELTYNWAKFSKTSEYVTFIGLVVSIVSLFSHLAIFLFVPTVRNLPGFCLASLSLSLLMAYLCFLTAFFLENEEFCAGLGMCVYYFFLSSFFWMNAIAFDVWRSFRVVMRELRITSNKVPWGRFLAYSLYSWAIPALLTILVKVFDSTEILPADYKPSFGYRFCWFGQRKAVLVFFAVPLIIVMLLNTAFFVDVIFVINRATIKSGSAQDANLRRSFAMFTRLALIMGLTWVFGIAAGFADKQFLWYIFIILNTLQGLFIFAVFLGSSKIRTLCSKKYRSRKRSSTSVRTVSATM